MRMCHMALVVLGIVWAARLTFADEAAPSAGCPSSVQAAMNTTLGEGTSRITDCLQFRRQVKSVFNVSSDAVHPKSGVAQQVNNARNMLDSYENTFGMRQGGDYDVVIVAHGGGGRWLLTDAAYNKLSNVSTGNPTRKLVQSLISKGIRVYMCQNTMKANGWVTADVIPGVRQVPSGVAAVVDFAMQGFIPITP